MAKVDDSKDGAIHDQFEEFGKVCLGHGAKPRRAYTLQPQSHVARTLCHFKATSHITLLLASLRRIIFFRYKFTTSWLAQPYHCYHRACVNPCNCLLSLMGMIKAISVPRGSDMDTVAEVFEPPMQPDSGGDVNIGGSAGGDVHL